jgi:hypothetical protein
MAILNYPITNGELKAKPKSINLRNTLTSRKKFQIQWIVRDRPAFEAAARIEKNGLKNAMIRAL